MSGDAATQTCATAILTIEDGPEANENVRVELPPDVYAAGVAPGVRLVLSRAPGNGDPDQFYSFSDFARGFPIAALALAIAVAVIAVARMRGLASILGLSLAFVILLKFMLPAQLAGSSPVLIGLVGSWRSCSWCSIWRTGSRRVRRRHCWAGSGVLNDAATTVEPTPVPARGRKPR